jgi:hypothetical protein
MRFRWPSDQDCSPFAFIATFSPIRLHAKQNAEKMEEMGGRKYFLVPWQQFS